MFPLNTDGIDVGGRDIHIHDCVIENFDDAVALKPQHGGPDASPDNPVLAACTENVLVEDVWVTNGVGMSVGSVSPHRGRGDNLYFYSIHRAPRHSHGEYR